MKHIRSAALIAVLSLIAVPSFSNDDAEYRNAVSTFIKLQGYECGSVLTVSQREEPNAFDVTCASGADGAGSQMVYFFQLSDDGAVVRQQ